MTYTKSKSGLLLPNSIHRVRARYDAAQTTSDNTRHWANADALSPDASLSPAVCRILRNRARYEAANNSYCKGMVLTLANDLVGTGPQLQLVTQDKTLNSTIEREFSKWSKRIKLAQKLRVMRMAKAIDGETFAVMAINRRLNIPIQLDIKLYEAEQVSSPMALLNNEVDGIEFDEYGNPSVYYILKNHPGSMSVNAFGDADKFDAEHVMHWYRVDRPGQSRGVCEIASSLPLFAQLRRYTLAVLSAAETAADFAAVLETMSPADTDGALVTPMDVIELEKRMMTVLPEGGKLNQIKAEQPTTTYADFKRQILGEVARCENVPLNVILGDSSDYNYASGRLDYQMYRKAIGVEQSDLEDTVLDRIFARWLNEAILISDYLPLKARNTASIRWQWMWDGNEHVDPQKEAKAQDVRLKNGSTNLAKEYSKSGKDWETETKQWTAEIKLIASELGVTPGEYLKIAVAAPQTANNSNGDSQNG
ncbi:MAG: phage portal protein [Sedimentisphaerales bacterium]